MKRKRLFLNAIVIICFMFLCACQSEKSKTEKDNSKTDSEQQTRIIGGYVEEKYEMPEGMEAIVPYAAKVVGDTGVMALGMKEDSYYVWNSEDYGKTWGKPTELPEELKGIVAEGDSTAGQRSIMSASISSDGEIAFIRATHYEDNNYTCDYWTWKPGEEEKKLNIELEMDEFYINHTRTQDSVCVKPNAFTKWKYTDTGELLAEAMNGQVYLVDAENGQIKVQTPYIQEMKRIEYTQSVGDKILVQTANGIFCYRSDTGEFTETDKDIQKDITELSSMGDYTYVGNMYEIFEADDSLYEIGKNGIYVRKGEEKEQIIPGEDAVIGNKMVRYLNAFCVEKKDFLIPCVENGKYYIVYYHYTGEEDTAKERGELNIYSLRENDNLTQVIELYKSRYSGITVRLETGLSEEGGVTVSDAIRNLSTKIMAGDGPDIILLDEMAVETYIKKGILKDITDIYEEVDKKEGLLNTVAGAYKKEEKLYAVTTHFYVPIILGSQSDIESIQNLESLETKAKEIHQNGKTILADKDVQGFLNYATAISSSAWLEDGKLQENKLRAFLESVKNICKSEELEEGTYNVDSHIQDFRDDYLQPIFYACGVNELSMGLAKGFSDISQIDSALNAVEGSSWKLQSGQTENVFVPSAIAGISGRAKNEEEAGEFLKYLLSAEAQTKEMGSGFPVNITALEQLAGEEPQKEEWSIMRMFQKTGETLDFTIKPASQERVQEFYESLKSVDTPEITDQIVLQTVKEYALSYIRGEINLDKAMDDIKSRINLHLAE